MNVSCMLEITKDYKLNYLVNPRIPDYIKDDKIESLSLIDFLETQEDGFHEITGKMFFLCRVNHNKRLWFAFNVKTKYCTLIIYPIDGKPYECEKTQLGVNADIVRSVKHAGYVICVNVLLSDILLESVVYPCPKEVLETRATLFIKLKELLKHKKQSGCAEFDGYIVSYVKSDFIPNLVYIIAHHKIGQRNNQHLEPMWCDYIIT